MRHNLVIGNAVGVEHGEKFGERIVTEAVAPRHQASFAAIVEADWIDLRDKQKERNFDTDIWKSRHRENDIDKDGCLALWDTRQASEWRKPEWALLNTNAWKDGKGQWHHEHMNSRYALTVFLEWKVPGKNNERQPITVVHFAPPRYAQLRAKGADAAGAYSLFMGDLNMTERALRRRYPDRKIRGTEVIHAVAKKDVNLGRSKKITLGDSDHPGVLLPLVFA